MNRSRTKILNLIFASLISVSTIGQQLDFYDLKYSDNDAKWVKNHKVSEKRTFEVTISEKGDSILVLKYLTAYNSNGNVSCVREFLELDTTTYDEVINRYEKNMLTETIAIMKDPYDDIKTIYKYRRDKLILMCDYSRISPTDKYSLDSCSTLIYNSGKLAHVKSNKRIASSFRSKGDTILMYDNNSELRSKYFNGKKIAQFSKDKRTSYQYNYNNELVRIINFNPQGDTLDISDFEWRNHLLVSERTRGLNGKDNISICKYHRRKE